MPTYSDAPLPAGLESLVGMGMNRVKIAIVIALVALGGLALALRKRWINRRGPRP